MYCFAFVLYKNAWQKRFCCTDYNQFKSQLLPPLAVMCQPAYSGESLNLILLQSSFPGAPKQLWSVMLSLYYYFYYSLVQK